MKQYEEIQKKILDLMKGRKDVTIFAIIDDKEGVSAMQDGCKHKETPFDGEESNKNISGCPTGCPFFEQ